MLVQKKWIEPLVNWRLWEPPAVMGILLLIVSQISFLTFHTMAEFFITLLSFVMFAFAWSTRTYSANNFLLFLACGYFWIGSLDLIHILLYEGVDEHVHMNVNMNEHVEHSDNLSDLFRFAVRSLEAFLLLAAPLAGPRKLNEYLLIGVFGIIAVGSATFIQLGQFPAVFVQGQGFANFTIYSEYLIVVVLALALIALFRYGRGVSTEEKALIAVAIAMTMCVELTTIFHHRLFGFSDQIGHVFKVFSFWFVFQAIVISNLKRPYEELIKEKETSQRQLAQIQEHESNFETIFNAIPDGIVVTDKHRVIVAANRGIQKIFGYTSDDLAGKQTSILFGNEDEYERQARVRSNALAAEKDKPYEVSYRAKDGFLFVGETMVTAVRGGDDEIVGFVGVIRDITERKMTEDKASRFGHIIDRSLNEIYIFDARTLKFLQVNHGAQANLGFTMEELMDLTPVSIKPEFTDETFKQMLRPLLDGDEDIIVFQTIHERKDGTTYGVEMHIQLMKQERSPIFVAIGLDITDRIDLETQLRRSQRMEAIGQLTGGIAHDFNNLLSVMFGNAELLKGKVGDDQKSKRRLESIIKAVDLGASLTNRLLAFSRRQNLSPQATHIDDLVLGLEDMLKRALGETIEFTTNLGAGGREALIDSSQLENALINLAVNARDAMSEGGVLTIETANVTLDETYARQNEEVAPGEYVMVAVGDTGEGMSPEVLEKVFEPFFTTKGVGQGSGLGLSMVYGFVMQSKGHVEIESEVGRGTTIKLYMPRSLEPASHHDSTQGDVFAPGWERILVVEDNDDVRAIPVGILRDQGYDVVEAVDGERAIQCIKDGPAFDLLFTDIILPGGMNGAQVAEKAKQIQPDIKVIFTTGYIEEARDQIGELDPGELVNKPYRRAELLGKVRAMLDNDA